MRQAGKHTVDGAVLLERQGLLELIRCQWVNIHGCQILDGAPYGIFAEDCQHVRVADCDIVDTRTPPRMSQPVFGL